MFSFLLYQKIDDKVKSILANNTITITKIESLNLPVNSKN